MKTAVMIIHGFAGDLSDHAYLEQYLKDNTNYDIYTFLLPGHEKKVVSGVTRFDWIKCVEDELKMIIDKKYDHIYVIGHSMGGLLAGYLAANYKEIDKLVLSAPAYDGLIFTDKGIDYHNGLKVGLRLIKDKDSTNSEVVKRIFRVAPKVTKELICLMQERREDIKNIHIPILLLHGTNDEIVPISSTEKLFKTIDSKTKIFIKIENITHPIYRTLRKEIACKYTTEFLRNNKEEIYEKII